MARSMQPSSGSTVSGSWEGLRAGQSLSIRRARVALADGLVRVLDRRR
jgi:hypothetical protein